MDLFWTTTEINCKCCELEVLKWTCTMITLVPASAICPWMYLQSVHECLNQYLKLQLVVGPVSFCFDCECFSLKDHKITWIWCVSGVGNMCILFCSPLGENALLMVEVRGEWADWFKLIEEQLFDWNNHSLQPR